MLPETDSNDHVPLEFLLGARVKHYYPDTSTATRSSKEKRVFASSIHPRRREEKARHLLQRVLDQNDPRRIVNLSESEVDYPAEPSKPSVLEALTEAASTPLFDDDAFQLSFGKTNLSPARIKSLQQLRDDELRRQNQRVTSFHGYKEENRPLLGVTGAAARIPRTNSRQLRDLKAKKQLKDEKTQELLEIVREQQKYTRTALHQHQQLTKSLQRQKHPGVVSTSLLSLDSIENDTSSRDCYGVSERTTVTPLQYPESYYQQYQSTEFEHPRLPALVTLNIDARALSPLDSLSGCDNTPFTDSSKIEDSCSDVDDDCEQVGKRLSDRQREVFACRAADGLFLGGGFISKKKKDKKSEQTPNNQAANTELLETVLGAQSAAILPLAQGNKPALRRREASAGRRHIKNSSLCS
ncbi:hypothetical protein GN244_ATG00868 [Phytophthora infestans]|uniref:Uncharacterized protein n=1 Tax=Phytophthora infestans TaxID=4787 RepID=A0A833TNX1_PHYIN|nr:hypothetical protein GN244_ATG00868 [Phytophthora infestans]KAF4130286.1 hypothetical protein GN958_ATG20701 [Phytophthora infestans]